MTIGSKIKSPELADRGLLKDVTGTAIVSVRLTLFMAISLSLPLCLAEHITLYAELS